MARLPLGDLTPTSPTPTTPHTTTTVNVATSTAASATAAITRMVGKKRQRALLWPSLLRPSVATLVAAFDDALLRHLCAFFLLSCSLAWLLAAVDLLPLILAQALMTALPLLFPNLLNDYLAHIATVFGLYNSVFAEIEHLAATISSSTTPSTSVLSP